MNRRPLPPVVAGPLAGLIATVPQTAAMAVARRLLPVRHLGRFPPRQVVEEAMALLPGRHGRPPHWREPAWRAITVVSHFGYGSVAAAGYGLMPAWPRPTWARGAAFGAIVWAWSYGVLLPTLGIRDPQADQPVRKNLQLLAAQLAYGVATAVLFERLTSPRPAAATGRSHSD